MVGYVNSDVLAIAARAMLDFRIGVRSTNAQSGADDGRASYDAMVDHW